MNMKHLVSGSTQRTMETRQKLTGVSSASRVTWAYFHPFPSALPDPRESSREKEKNRVRAQAREMGSRYGKMLEMGESR